MSLSLSNGGWASGQASQAGFRLTPAYLPLLRSVERSSSRSPSLTSSLSLPQGD